MPKVTDHEARRRELAEALLRVAARDGFAAVSVRTVAAEAGCSPGALRHYHASQDTLVVAALEQLTERVAARLQPRLGALRDAPDDEAVARAAELLEELLPLDPSRSDEMAVWLGLIAPNGGMDGPARWREQSFLGFRRVCREVVERLRRQAATTWTDEGVERRVAALHALLDGLALHVIGYRDHLAPDAVRGTLRWWLQDLVDSR